MQGPEWKKTHMFPHKEQLERCCLTHLEAGGAWYLHCWWDPNEAIVDMALRFPSSGIQNSLAFLSPDE